VSAISGGAVKQHFSKRCQPPHPSPVSVWKEHLAGLEGCQGDQYSPASCTKQSKGQRQASSFLYLYPFCLTIAWVSSAWETTIVMLTLLIVILLIHSNSGSNSEIIIIVAIIIRAFFSVCEKK